MKKAFFSNLANEMSNPDLEIDFFVIHFNNCLVIKLPKRLTLIESISLKESCSESIKQNKAGQKVILDFKDTQFIDSNGIGALIKILVVARAYQQELIFQRVQPSVIAVLEMASLTEVFQIQSTKLLSTKESRYHRD